MRMKTFWWVLEQQKTNRRRFEKREEPHTEKLPLKDVICHCDGLKKNLVLEKLPQQMKILLTEAFGCVDLLPSQTLNENGRQTSRVIKRFLLFITKSNFVIRAAYSSNIDFNHTDDPWRAPLYDLLPVIHGDWSAFMLWMWCALKIWTFQMQRNSVEKKNKPTHHIQALVMIHDGP